MTILNQVMSEQLAHALGWTILHAVWQVSLLAIVMGIVISLLKNKSAKVRYTVGCVTLFLMLGISQVTFLYQFLNYQPKENIAKQLAVEPLKNTTNDTDESVIYIITTKTDWFSNMLETLNEHTQWIATFWVFGFLLFAIRMLFGFSYIVRLRKSAKETVDKKWAPILHNLANKFPIKKTVQLAESAMIQVPMIVGYFKPLILFPIGTLNALSEKEVEAILAHELSHVFRNDYIVNIFQSIVDVLFYFHPAAWWISAQVRMERENCCDDLAIDITTCSLTYAKALVAVEEQSKQSPLLAMALKKDNKKLLTRIKRILNPPQHNNYNMEKLITTCLLMFLVFGLTIGAVNPFAETSEKDDLVAEEITDVTAVDKKTKQPIDAIVETLNSSASKLDSVSPILKERLVFDKDGVVLTHDHKGESIDSKNKWKWIEDENGSAKLVDIAQPGEPYQSKNKWKWIEDEKGNAKLVELNDTIPPTKKPRIIIDNNGNTKIITTNSSYNKLKIRTENGNKSIEVQLDNGEIKKLKINGKKIPKSEYKNYEKEIATLIEDTPPPIPPVPPVAPVAPVPPVQPATPELNTPEPPAPPPVPKAPNENNGIGVIEKDGKIYIEIDKEHLDEPIDISIDGENVVIEGKPLGKGDHNIEVTEFLNDEMNAAYNIEIELDNKKIDELFQENKYPENLKELHNKYNRQFSALRKFETFDEKVEKLSRRYNQELEREMERIVLKMEAQLHRNKLNREKTIKKAQAMRTLAYRKSDLLQKKIGNELVKDGLIDEIRNFKFDMNNKRMKVNGKSYDGPVYMKYRKIYESLNGKIKGKSSYRFQNIAPEKFSSTNRKLTAKQMNCKTEKVEYVSLRVSHFCGSAVGHFAVLSLDFPYVILKERSTRIQIPTTFSHSLTCEPAPRVHARHFDFNLNFDFDS